MQFSHYNLEVPAEKMPELLEFYRALFAWQPGPRPQSSRPGYWLYEGEQAWLHLSQARTPGAESQSTGALNHIAFCLPSLVPIREKLQTLGIAFEHKTLPDVGLSQLFFYDPAGLKIELNGPLL